MCDSSSNYYQYNCLDVCCADGEFELPLILDPKEDADYSRLLTDEPLTFHHHGIPIETPDLARFHAAQSGVEMLSCLKHNFFPDYEMPTKWEHGEPPRGTITLYSDEISATLMRVIPARPTREIRITKRG